MLVAAGALLPIGYLLYTVAGEGSVATDQILSDRALQLLLRSCGLAAAVTAASVAIALPLSWLCVRTDLPGRRLWTVLTALPLVIPSYIGAYLFISAVGPRGELAGWLGVHFPSIYGFFGAWLVLTLFCFPLVLLPLSAVLRRLDPGLEEAARSLGRSPWATYRTVVLPQLAPAIAAGGLLVALYVLSDFGAVSLMRFDSFTRSIYVSYRSSFDRVGAASLATVLVAVTLVVLWLETRTRRAATAYGRGGTTARAASRVPLGRWRWPALAFCAFVVLIALVLPVGMLAYWSQQSLSSGVDTDRLLDLAWHSLEASLLAAAAAAACAVPVALLATRHAGRAARLIEGASYSGHALPGIVVALALVFFGTRAVFELYQTLAMLVIALVVLFLPQAVGAARAALLQVPPRLEEAGRSLGRSPVRVFVTVTAPLARGGVLAGAALVFLTAIKELPATLILAPIGFETLATDIWQTTTVGSYEGAAVPSLVLLGVSAIPLAILASRDR